MRRLIVSINDNEADGGSVSSYGIEIESHQDMSMNQRQFYRVYKDGELLSRGTSLNEKTALRWALESIGSNYAGE